MIKVNKAWGHFRTITRHRHFVIKHCLKAGIFWQGLRHDLSKYTLTEFLPGACYYQGSRSPNEKERELYGYSRAWLHHKGRNKHHFEYWMDYDPKTKSLTGVLMPLKYVKEMFCDRVAASKIYLKEAYTDQSPLEYFLKGKDTRLIHPETSALIEQMLRMLAQKGEEETFIYIKSIKG